MKAQKLTFLAGLFLCLGASTFTQEPKLTVGSLRDGDQPELSKALKILGGAALGAGTGTIASLAKSWDAVSASLAQVAENSEKMLAGSYKLAQSLSPEAQAGYLLGQIAGGALLTILVANVMRAIGAGKLISIPAAAVPAIYTGASSLGVLTSLLSTIQEKEKNK